MQNDLLKFLLIYDIHFKTDVLYKLIAYSSGRAMKQCLNWLIGIRCFSQSQAHSEVDKKHPCYSCSCMLQPLYTDISHYYSADTLSCSTLHHHLMCKIWGIFCLTTFLRNIFHITLQVFS